MVAKSRKNSSKKHTAIKKKILKTRKHKGGAFFNMGGQPDPEPEQEGVVKPGEGANGVTSVKSPEQQEPTLEPAPEPAPAPAPETAPAPAPEPAPAPAPEKEPASIFSGLLPGSNTNKDDGTNKDVGSRVGMKKGRKGKKKTAKKKTKKAKRKTAKKKKGKK